MNGTVFQVLDLLRQTEGFVEAAQIQDALGLPQMAHAMAVLTHMVTEGLLRYEKGRGYAMPLGADFDALIVRAGPVAEVVSDKLSRLTGVDESSTNAAKIADYIRAKNPSARDLSQQFRLTMATAEWIVNKAKDVGDDYQQLQKEIRRALMESVSEARALERTVKVGAQTFSLTYDEEDGDVFVSVEDSDGDETTYTVSLGGSRGLKIRDGNGITMPMSRLPKQVLDVCDDMLDTDDDTDESLAEADLAGAKKYIASIKNDSKQTYAEIYLRYCQGKDDNPSEFVPSELSYMAAQAVRMELARFGFSPKGESVDESVSEATGTEHKGKEIEALADEMLKTGVGVLVLSRRAQPSKWDYSVRNPKGGSSGSSLEIKDTDRAVVSILARTSASYAGSRYFVIIGQQGKNDPNKVARAYFTDLPGAKSEADETNGLLPNTIEGYDRVIAEGGLSIDTLPIVLGEHFAFEGQLDLEDENGVTWRSSDAERWFPQIEEVRKKKGYWRTTKSGRRIYIENGKITKGNPKLLAHIQASNKTRIRAARQHRFHESIEEGAPKKPATMTAAQINAELDRLDQQSTKITDEMLSAGRGGETFSQSRTKSDPLAKQRIENAEREMDLRAEIEARYGSRIGRLPIKRGSFGPRESIDEARLTPQQAAKQLRADITRYNKESKEWADDPLSKKVVAKDVTDLQAVADLLSDGDVKGAYRRASLLDTAVRDAISNPVWKLMSGGAAFGHSDNDESIAESVEDGIGSHQREIPLDIGVRVRQVSQITNGPRGGATGVIVGIKGDLFVVLNDAGDEEEWEAMDLVPETQPEGYRDDWTPPGWAEGMQEDFQDATEGELLDLIEGKPKLGTGARFKALSGKLAKRGVRDPKALAAWIGRKKYGAKKFGKLSHHESVAEGFDKTLYVVNWHDPKRPTSGAGPDGAFVSQFTDEDEAQDFAKGKAFHGKPAVAKSMKVDARTYNRVRSTETSESVAEADEGYRRIKLGTYVGPEGSGRAGDVFLLLARRGTTKEVPADSFIEWDGERMNIDRLPGQFDKLLPTAYAHAPLSAWKKLLDAVAFKGTGVFESEYSDEFGRRYTEAELKEFFERWKNPTYKIAFEDWRAKHFTTIQEGYVLAVPLEQAAEVDIFTIMRALQPNVQLSEAKLDHEVQATEVMRINTRSRSPQDGSVPSRIDISDYQNFAVFDDGSVVREAWIDGRNTRSLIAKIDPADITKYVESIRALVSDYTGPLSNRVADVTTTIGESVTEAKKGVGMFTTQKEAETQAREWAKKSGKPFFVARNDDTEFVIYGHTAARATNKREMVFVVTPEGKTYSGKDAVAFAQEFFNERPPDAERDRKAKSDERDRRMSDSVEEGVLSRLFRHRPPTAVPAHPARPSGRPGRYSGQATRARQGHARVRALRGESADEAQLDEFDPITAIVALGTVAVGAGVGAGVVKAIRTIKEFMRLGNKTAAEKTYDHLSKDDQRALRALTAKRESAEMSEGVTVKYRIPGKGGWKVKSFETQALCDKFVDRLIEKEGDDVEIQYANDDSQSATDEGYQHVAWNGSSPLRFQVSTPSGKKSVQGRTFGGKLGLHMNNKIGEWVLTHIPTGLRLGGTQGTEDKLIGIAKSLETQLGDKLDFTDPAEATDDVRQAIAAARKKMVEGTTDEITTSATVGGFQGNGFARRKRTKSRFSPSLDDEDYDAEIEAMRTDDSIADEAAKRKRKGRDPAEHDYSGPGDDDPGDHEYRESVAEEREDDDQFSKGGAGGGPPLNPTPLQKKDRPVNKGRDGAFRDVHGSAKVESQKRWEETTTFSFPKDKLDLFTKTATQYAFPDSTAVRITGDVCEVEIPVPLERDFNRIMQGTLVVTTL